MVHSLLIFFQTLPLAIAADPAVESHPNLVENPGFAATGDEFPTAWRDGQQQQQVSLDMETVPPGAERSLRIEITTQYPGRSGEIGQTIRVKPHTRYRIAGWLRGSRSGIAWYQVKRRKGRQELERVDSSKNTEEWTQVSTIFNSGEADNVIVLCRWAQGSKQVGQTARFANVELIEASDLPLEGAHEPVAISTFESIGLYWKPGDGSPDNQCQVSYRASGATSWMEGHDLWFDPNHHEGRPQNSQEYRGSLVHLQPGTEYEIRLRLDETKTERILSARTWDEEFKVKKTVTLPERWEETLQISEGGSAEDGYVVYAPSPGQQSIADARGEYEVNVRVKAPYVIIRGLVLRNAAAHGIELKDVHHVVIEDCDVSGWGRILEDGFGSNGDGAVYGSSPMLEHIVVQRCDFHHPRSHSNSWNEERTLADGRKTSHPMGPQGIMLRKGKGRYVIRHNRIRSDMTRMFNDGMGEFSNFSFAGFPNRDSDIYGNFVSHCRDDGFECEGANMNVRVWNNCTDVCMMSMAGATTSLGPIYFWRNIALRSRYGPTDDLDGTKGGGFLKLGNESTWWTKGRMVVYHNTMYQPESWPGRKDPSGCRAGLICTGETKRQQNLVSRNNIIHCRREQDRAINDPFQYETNDFDYDLIHGKVDAREGSETHGIWAVPQYERTNGSPPGLRPGTPGYDAGCRLPNFNDHFEGSAPDMGAVETGQPFARPSTWPAFPELFQFEDQR